MTRGLHLNESLSPPNARRAYLLTRAEVFAVVAVAVLAGALMGPLLVGTGQRDRHAADLMRCQENLRRIGTAFQAYTQDSAALPVSPALTGPHPAMVHALMGRYLSDPSMFYCPAGPSPQPPGEAADTRWKKGDIGYFYYSAESHGPDETLSRFLLADSLWPRRLTSAMPADTWVMSDKWYSAVPTAHTEYKKGVNYLMLDGRVDFVADGIRIVLK